MVKYIEPHVTWTDIFATSYHPNVEVLKYFLDKGFTIRNNSICKMAIEQVARGIGDADYIFFAIDNGAPMTKSLMTSAARGHHIGLMKELRAKGCK